MEERTAGTRAVNVRRLRVSIRALSEKPSPNNAVRNNRGDDTQSAAGTNSSMHRMLATLLFTSLLFSKRSFSRAGL